MTVIAALIGLLTGALLNWVADYLPRFSGESQPEPSRSSLTLGSWQFVRARRSPNNTPDPWVPLHMGVELLTACAFAFLYSRYGQSPDLLFYAVFVAFFLLIATIDLKYRLVPNVLTYPAMLVVLVGQALLARHNVLSIMLGGGLAFGIFFLTARLKPGDLGGGDVKLATLIGLMFGFPGVLVALLAGAGTGALGAMFLALRRRDGGKLYFPYAPFLCLGAIVALLCSPFLTAL